MTRHSRRKVLRGASLAGLVGASTVGAGVVGSRAVEGPSRDGVPTFVIVTGANGGSGGINELALRGFRTVGVDLPGHRMTDAQFRQAYQSPQDLAALAVEGSPLRGIGLDEYAAAVEEVVRTCASYGPVILVGGSMGGASISRVGNAVPGLIDRVVYDSAFVCVARETIAEYLTLPEAASTQLPVLAEFSIGDPQRIGAGRSNWRIGDPELLARAKRALMAEASDAEFLAMLNSLHPDESVTVPMQNARVEPGTWGTIPRTYIRHTRDACIPPALQDTMIAEADALTPENRFDVRSVAAGHTATVAQYREIVDMLAELGNAAHR